MIPPLPPNATLNYRHQASRLTPSCKSAPLPTCFGRRWVRVGGAFRSVTTVVLLLVSVVYCLLLCRSCLLFNCLLKKNSYSQYFCQSSSRPRSTTEQHIITVARSRAPNPYATLSCIYVRCRQSLQKKNAARNKKTSNIIIGEGGHYVRRTNNVVRSK